MKITRAVVPSLFTTLNVFCGFLSILNVAESHFHTAAWFIILAAIFDSLDGVMARITRSSSQFGVELDSLADVVSFGAAPSFMVYKAYLYSFENWGVIIAALPVVFGAIRLARFNVQLVGYDKDYFNGLPIPLQAVTVCAFIFHYYGEGFGLTGWSGSGLIILVVVLSFLMVSRIKYDTIPKFTKRQIKAHPWKFVTVTIGILIILISKGTLLFPLLALYIIFGIIRSIVHGLTKTFKKTEDELKREEKLSRIDI
ncbi:MAG: CDP-diacylglycerol--serine O-phosphatidyltransferase [Bacteroidetes bacterium]|nr:CDP-diacylglycerol--serine O-phosphatidyltransferase [Bacteroidota bacterium]